MALDDPSGQERTEQPSARRREEARARGQVVKSPDLSAAILLLAGLGVWAMAGPRLMADAIELVRASLSVSPRVALTADGLGDVVLPVLRGGAWLAAPLLLVPAAIAIGSQLAQTRGALAWRALAPDWSRLSPARALGRMFGLAGLVELIKATAKLAAIGTVAAFTLREHWPLLAGLGETGVGAVPAALGRVLGRLWLEITLAYLAVAALDYGWQWWRHERGLRMTREEVREETRQTEGNPLLRSRLRSVHRLLVSRKMLAEVKRADVVVRNPTHVAVAMRYEGGRMRAPRVVAKGADHMALRIIDIARKHAVPVIENPPLARTLFALVKVGAEIPAQLYRAVAEILAQVYAIRGVRS
jgi:flagellar biosynthetic protein FlhB